MNTEYLQVATQAENNGNNSILSHLWHVVAY